MPDSRACDIVIADDEAQVGSVQCLWLEYWDSLRLPPEFQNFSLEVTTLPGSYALPQGRLLLAHVNGEPAGTAALRPLGGSRCEAKRLYVRPPFRAQGVGRALLGRLAEEARAAGYLEMYGDTLKSMTAALDMYGRLGFREVGPYSASPTPEAIFLRLDLSGGYV